MRRRYVLTVSAGALVLAGLGAFWLIAPAQSQTGPSPVAGPVKAQALSLPIKQVVLFSSGVGYFQREAEIDGSQRIDLSFPVTDINDLLKSLVLQDLGGGQVSAVSYDSRDPVEKTLRSFAIDLTSNPTFGQLLNQARGEKIEVVMQPSTTQPFTLAGFAVGVEPQRQATPSSQGGPGGVIDTEILNILTAEGLRSLPLSQVQRVRFLNPVLDAELKRALEVLALSHDVQKKTVSLNFTGEGKRPVRVGYVVENPIWKTSYRLVLNDKGKPFLQGWAVVENPTDEDWNQVQMALVSGRPISFQMDLYQPLYVPRPMVEPELFASLRPQAYGGAMDPKPGRPSPPFGAFPESRAATGITARLSTGERPMTVKTAPLTNTAGFVRPGDRVDVVATTGNVAQTVLQDVEVLAVDQNADGRRQADLVTLRVNAPQAERLGALGSSTLRLVPRRADGSDSSLSLRGFATGLAREEERLGVTFGFGPTGGRSAELNLAKGIASAATATEMGDYFQYQIAQPVTLARQKSAMIPIVNQAVEGTKVSIYNEAVHAKYPLHGLRFKNTAGVHLMQGPVTVFEGNSYAGDARVMDLQPGEERLLSYAIDLGTEVEPAAKPLTDEIKTVKIVKGLIHATHKYRQIKTYNVKNRSEHERTVLIEHPFRSEWKLVTPEKPAERSRDVYRFQLAVAPGKTVSQEVVEEMEGVNQVSVGNRNDPAVGFFISHSASSPKVKEALQRVQELLTKQDDAQRQFAQVEQRLREIGEDQTRLRANLKEMPPTAAAYKRYLEKFDTQETEIEKLQEQAKQERRNVEERRKEYEAFLAGLNVD